MWLSGPQWHTAHSPVVAFLFTSRSECHQHALMIYKLISGQVTGLEVLFWQQICYHCLAQESLFLHTSLQDLRKLPGKLDMQSFENLKNPSDVYLHEILSLISVGATIYLDGPATITFLLSIKQEPLFLCRKLKRVAIKPRADNFQTQEGKPAAAFTLTLAFDSCWESLISWTISWVSTRNDKKIRKPEYNLFMKHISEKLWR